MKCFNHEDREAVATCQKCGKGLCKECAAKYNPCLCDDCANIIRRDRRQQEQAEIEARRQKYLNALIDTKGEFIRTCIVGVIIVVAFFWLMSQGEEPIIIEVKILTCSFFFIPFGWKMLTYWQFYVPNNIIGTTGFWAAVFFIKAFIGYFVGIPAFFYQLYKTIQNEKEIKRLS